MLWHCAAVMTTNAQDSNATTQTPAAVTPATVALMYLRAEQVIQLLPVSRRTISNWQRQRRLKFYRVGRTILFKRSDIEACLEKYAVNPIGEVKPRKVTETGAITSAPVAQRKRRARRIAAPASDTESQP